ncbi:MAG: chromosomal replication initiator protein DnaA [Lactobacillaceae bacterium]|jgi:chromosomal replication initiator protein|nr:chromosomal replication initiator protein DnaA [Lactobacillaceae bacterium]
MDHFQLWDAIKLELHNSIAEGFTFDTYVNSLTPVTLISNDNGTGTLYLTTTHKQVEEAWKQPNGDYFQAFAQAAMVATQKISGTPTFIQPTITLLADSMTSVAPFADSTASQPIFTPTSNNTMDFLTDSILNPNYRFDTYVVSQANGEAYNVARSIAENPIGSQYNPMFIYGESGLGKTHLMQAIGNEIIARNPDAKVKFITTEEFTNDWFEALRRTPEVVEAFKAEYRNVDLLLIDDIQFLASNKEKTNLNIQEEFFNTFNVITRNNHQVVMTSDKAPKDIPGIEDRLVSRFSMGYKANVTLPDIATRIGILRNEAENENIHIDNDVIEEIAAAVDTNIRDLKGIFNKLVAKVKFTNEPVDVKVAQELLEAENFERHRVITIPIIQDAVAEYFNVNVDDILGKKRTQEIVIPRQIAMYLAREITQESLPAIGRAFGGKDHTTVMHSTEKIDKLIEEDRNLDLQIRELREKLHE